MKNIVLLAAPAGGKGTISKYISEKYGYEHISIGDLLRSEIRNKTEIGINISSLMKKGLLIDDQIIFKVLRNRLLNQNNNFIIDGVPRTLNQAKMYDELLSELNITLDKVLYISVDKDVALSRIDGRLVCGNCNSVYNIHKDNIKDNKCLKCGNKLSKRSDDKKSTFEKRYKIFEEETRLLFDYYGDLVKEIKNNTTLDVTYSQIDNIFMEGDND